MGQCYVTFSGLEWLFSWVTYVVPCYITSAVKAFATDGTVVRWFSCVPHNMYFRPACDVNVLTTDVANVWFLSSVCSDVLSMVTVCNKPFTTGIIDVWFISSVCSDVLSMVTVCNKPFTTGIIGVWFLSSVCSDVLSMVTVCNKPFTTGIIGVWFISSVCSDVLRSLSATNLLPQVLHA